MKRKQKMVLIFLLFGLAAGAFNPLLIWGAEIGGGNPWDIYLDPKPYHGLSLNGTIVANFGDAAGCPSNCAPLCANFTDYLMAYTVTLNYKGYPYTLSDQTRVCLEDNGSQAQIIKNALWKLAGNIFKKVKEVKVESFIGTPTSNYDSTSNTGYFLAAIVVHVQK
jgi:hypothetical protein